MRGWGAGTVAVKIPATWEAEMGRFEVRGQPGQKVRELPFWQISYGGLCTCNPSYMVGIGRRIEVWGYFWAKMRDPTWKITKAKSRGVTQMAEHLPSKGNALSSNSSTNPYPTPPKNKKRNEGSQSKGWGRWRDFTGPASDNLGGWRTGSKGGCQSFQPLSLEDHGIFINYHRRPGLVGSRDWVSEGRENTFGVELTFIARWIQFLGFFDQEIPRLLPRCAQSSGSLCQWRGWENSLHWFFFL
jgi:hypothetical protein